MSFLSRAGKEALIKSCLQAYPVYAMRCFRFPKTPCDELSAQAIRFWWASRNKSRGVHWVNKHIMLREKCRGGMGFRCFETLNITLLMKQIWRICKHSNLLITQVLKAKYFKNHNILEARQKSSGSFAWKSLCSLKVELIGRILIWVK